MDRAELDQRALKVFGSLALRALMAIRASPDPVADFVRWLPILARLLAAPSGLQRLGTLIEYVLTVSKVEPEGLRNALAHLGTTAEETVMNTAERLRKEGHDEGQRELVARLLQLQFGPLSEDVAARLRAAEADTLRTWAERLLTAPTLDAVFDPADPSAAPDGAP